MNSSVWLLGLFLLFVDQSAAGEELAKEARLPDDILAKKQEGSYFTGVPAIAFSPDSGFIYGAVIFNFDNGERNDERFAYTPYLRKTSVLAIQSTKGLSQLKIDLDFPRLMNSNHRFKPAFYFTNNISEQYFGVTENSLGSLVFPTDVATEIGKSSTNDYLEYEEELQKKRTSGNTWFRYNQYIHKESELQLNDEISVLTPFTFFKLGLSSAKVSIDDYTNKDVDAFDPSNKKKQVRANSAETQLAVDQANGDITGFSGGNLNAIEIGMSVDTRDFEPDPSSGSYAALSAQTFRKELASDYNFALYTANIRHFLSPHKTLTLGAQAQYVWAEGDVPFWKLPAIGGRKSLKGHRVNRFKAAASSQLNGEVRWRAQTLSTGSQTFVLTPLFYADYGRVYDDILIIKTEGWRRSLGLGLRIVWNQATVIGIEKPLQGEEKSLYVNINHIF